MSDMTAMGSDPPDMALNASGVDFSNSTQAEMFLGDILDDTVFQVTANQYARDFWYGVCAIISFCAILNVAQKITCQMRMRAAATNQARPAAPSNVFSKCLACLKAIGREATYRQFTPRNSRFLKVPPVGTIALLVGYLAWVILLEFVHNNVEGAQHYTSLAVRASWLAIAQVPLLILLAGKNNLIGLVTGISYERLNVLHRWVARGFLFTATLHVIFLHMAWNKYDLGPLEYATDSCVPTGWAVYAILIWMNVSTIAPIRNLSYEFFVIQHIITWIGIVVAILMHLPSTALYSRVYIYIPIALYLIDRITRSARYAWNNVRPGRAILVAMAGDVTRISVQSKTIKKWAPGSHVFLSIPRFGVGQSHPATIASTPTSHNGDLIFILKGHKGFTSRLLKSAASSSTSLLSTKEKGSELSAVAQVSYVALIDGPYGNSYNDLAAYDSILLVSGSTGVTFNLPILLDIASRVQNTRLPVKRITFLWIVKNTSWTSWISQELTSAAQTLLAAGIELSICIHVTCDNAFTTGDEPECCACDKKLGPCCCVNLAEVQSDGSGVKSRALPCAKFYSGRPDIFELLWAILEKAEGETGVTVCGPIDLNVDVRKMVVKCSDERAVHKGTGAQGIYLHTECFGW